MLPAAGVACALAGVGAAAVLRRAGPALAFALLAIAVALSLARAGTLDDQVREGVRVARVREDLQRAIAAAGGAAMLRRCALGGWLAVNHTTKTTLVWELGVPLDRVAGTMRERGILFRAAHTAATGAPAPVTLPRPLRRVPLARAGAWRVTLVAPIGTPPPVACRRR
jgi:hypothetical protein